MSGLLFLTADDFTVENGTKGKILCNPIPSFSLVLFYSNQCKHCKTLVPIFKKLPGTIGGCQFGLLNVGTNMKVVQKSKGTVTEIQYVPLIILYINGKPFMRYAGKYNQAEIVQFVVSMSKRVQTKEAFVNKNNNSLKPDPAIKEDPRGGIPAFSIGTPLKGDGRFNVCYLDFQNAYSKQLKKLQSSRRVAALPSGAGMGSTPGMRRH
jgi:thiol-disulfide isomerase/thioredoxin